jgi:hypothetical protein
VTVAVEEAREMVKHIQSIFGELELLVACLVSLAEISYLHVKDLTVFIRRRSIEGGAYKVGGLAVGKGEEVGAVAVHRAIESRRGKGGGQR